MFFLVSFDLIDRRGLSPTQAGLVFLPFTLGVGLLSRPFGVLADKIGARTMLIVGPLGAALAFAVAGVGPKRSLVPGVLVPMALLGLSFAVLVTPLTASVMSSVAECRRRACLRRQQRDEPGGATGGRCARRRRGLLCLRLSAPAWSSPRCSPPRAPPSWRRLLPRAKHRRKRMNEKLPARRRHSRSDAERARLRGMPEDRLALGAFAAMPDLRPCRLLRFLAQQTRHQTFPRHRPSGHRGLRSAGRLGLVLCRRDFRRPRRAHDAAARADPEIRVN